MGTSYVMLSDRGAWICLQRAPSGIGSSSGGFCKENWVGAGKPGGILLLEKQMRIAGWGSLQIKGRNWPQNRSIWHEYRMGRATSVTALEGEVAPSSEEMFKCSTGTAEPLKFEPVK